MGAGITGVAGLAVGIFGHQIDVYEETAARVKGRAEITVGADRTIFGSIQPLSDKQQELLPPGVRTGGELVLHTAANLYYRDVAQSGTREQRQTFVRHNFEVWRVIAVQNWKSHSGQARYILTKYVRDDS